MTNKNETPLYGAIEGGGTKFICAIGSGSNNIWAEARFTTTTPEETMGQVIEFFQQQEEKVGKLSAIGFACFGPLDPNPASPTYGYILPTPKPGWSSFCFKYIMIISILFANHDGLSAQSDTLAIKTTIDL